MSRNPKLQLFGMVGLKSSDLEMGFVELGNGSKKVCTFVGNWDRWWVGVCVKERECVCVKELREDEGVF
jgi:hypothetical protein